MSTANAVEPVREPEKPASGAVRRFPFLTALVLSVLIVGCSFYGKVRNNLGGENFLVAHNGENFQIGKSLYAGEGFANPMGEKTGPTAWCAPAYPALLVTLLWLGDGDHDVVIGGVALLQVCVLLGTGILVLALVWQTTRRIGPFLVAAVFLGGLVDQFWNWFQVIQDCWLMLLTFDLLIAGFCWCGPLANWQRATCWGVFGGLCALVNPSIGLPWGVLTLALGLRSGSWFRPCVAVLAAILTLMPWTVRNYLVLGRWIPVKANLAYELYQTQCLQDDGLYQSTTSRLHPSARGSRERQAYKALGEVAYLDRKRQQFWEAVWADPEDFLDRVASRFLGATVWYVPFNRTDEARRPWVLWPRRLVHPLPFLALVFLLFTGFREPLRWPQWTAIAVYVLFLLPYIAASYYPRYAVPLVAVKVLLVIWAADRLLSLGKGETANV